MADEKDDNKGQKDAQKAHAKNLEAQNKEKEDRRIKAESGPVSVMEKTQANPNPPDVHRHTPRHEAQTASGMDDNTLQEDVGLRNKKTGLQPSDPEDAGKVDNATGISTHQPLIPPQGDALSPKDNPKGKKGAAKSE